jgi:hypothetical protein
VSVEFSDNMMEGTLVKEAGIWYAIWKKLWHVTGGILNNQVDYYADESWNVAMIFQTESKRMFR